MATLSWSTTLPHFQCFINPSGFNVFSVLLYHITSPLHYDTQSDFHQCYASWGKLLVTFTTFSVENPKTGFGTRLTTSLTLLEILRATIFKHQKTSHNWWHGFSFWEPSCSPMLLIFRAWIFRLQFEDLFIIQSSKARQKSIPADCSRKTRKKTLEKHWKLRIRIPLVVATFWRSTIEENNSPPKPSKIKRSH